MCLMRPYGVALRTFDVTAGFPEAQSAELRV